MLKRKGTNPLYFKVLLRAGGATVGTMYFKLGENGTWSTEWPTAINAGDYDIYYYVNLLIVQLPSHV